MHKVVRVPRGVQGAVGEQEDNAREITSFVQTMDLTGPQGVQGAQGRQGIPRRSGCCR
jgi:hypothetical protein